MPVILYPSKERERKMMMKLFLKLILGGFLALFALSGLLVLLTAALGLTFGVVGGAIALVWHVVSNPVVLVLIVVVLALALNNKAKAG